MKQLQIKSLVSVNIIRPTRDIDNENIYDILFLCCLCDENCIYEQYLIIPIEINKTFDTIKFLHRCHGNCT